MRDDTDLWVELEAEIKRFFRLDRIMWERLIRACGLRWQARYTQELAQRQRCAEFVIKRLAQRSAPALEVPSAGPGMECPACGSSWLWQVDNLHSVWACRECGYQGDGSLFEVDRRRS